MDSQYTNKEKTMIETDSQNVYYKMRFGLYGTRSILRNIKKAFEPYSFYIFAENYRYCLNN